MDDNDTATALPPPNEPWYYNARRSIGSRWIKTEKGEKRYHDTSTPLPTRQGYETTEDTRYVHFESYLLDDLVSTSLNRAFKDRLIGRGRPNTAIVPLGVMRDLEFYILPATDPRLHLVEQKERFFYVKPLPWYLFRADFCADFFDWCYPPTLGQSHRSISLALQDLHWSYTRLIQDQYDLDIAIEARLVPSGLTIDQFTAMMDGKAEGGSSRIRYGPLSMRRMKWLEFKGRFLEHRDRICSRFHKKVPEFGDV